MTESLSLSAAAPEAGPSAEPRLTSLAHGGGCGCKIAPGVLAGILRGSAALPVPPDLLVGIETSDDAAVYRVNERQAVVATTDFFMPIVDDPIEFGRVASLTAKQVITQKVREAERERQYEEYKDRVGEIVNGIVKRVEYGHVIVDLGRAEAVIRRDQCDQ